MSPASCARVTDALKTAALLGVVAGHSLAWTITPSGNIASTLDELPSIWWVTWVLQVLPLFFVLSSTGMRRLGEAQDGRQLASRVSLLVAPVLPLYLIGILITSVVQVFSPEQTRVAGVLLVQLTWFVGVYVLILAAAPLLTRLSDQGVIGWFAGVAIVDVLRIYLAAPLGWLNMFMVWAGFMLIGLRLERLRQIGIRRQLAILGISLSCAFLLISYGPYSRALISTRAVPGLSNLAPPSVVLLSYGIAQTMAMLLLWPYLARLISLRPVDHFFSAVSSRAMQIYLYHLLIVGVCAGGLAVAHIHPTALQPPWWITHIAVFASAVAITYLASNLMRTVAGGVLVGITRIARSRFKLSKKQVTSLAIATGLLILHIAARGVGNPFVSAGGTGLGIPPAISLVAIFLFTAVLNTTSARTTNGTNVEA